ncbi:MAG TPA: hypothetical protein VMS64_37125 [Candidatus Methylomirabilis sp.]|nr:hypothetical protein [Candidatus Methylomirabilis sp.]
MGGPDSSSRSLTFQELPELRRKTEAISRFLHEQLSTHLETLRPILSPERLFGKPGSSTGGKGEIPLADRALAQLQQSYRPFSGPPFNLPSELDQYWLTLVGNKVSLHPWEYTHQARTERESRPVTMTSPVRWVVSFSSTYTLSHVKQALAGKGERRPEHIRQFVINALVTQLVVTHTPGLAPLFADLRYQLHTDSVPDLPKVPLTTIISGLPSFRPDDDLILAATNFSGVPAFIELIDIGALATLRDPLKARIEDLLH